MTLKFFVNGKLVQEDNPDPGTFLANYLRRKVGLTGTKVACGEGGCGSCTVLQSKFDRQTLTFRHFTINSCITPLRSVQGSHILTIEGIAGQNSKSCHYIQDAIAQGNGTQCGFCTPGMVMSMHGLMTSNKTPTIAEIKGAIQGNLCRCTGYRPILEAFRKCLEISIEDLPNNCSPCLENKRNVNFETSTRVPEIETLLKNFNNTESKSKIKTSDNKSLSECSSWLQPTSLSELVAILNMSSEIQIVGGSTELALQQPLSTGNYVHIGLVSEMQTVELQETSVRFGAALTISEIMAQLQKVTKMLPVEKTRALMTISELLEKFGSPQIRNSATLGGSIMSTNNASDIQTLMAALKCRIECINSDAKDKSFKFMEDIRNNKFKGLIVAIEVALTEKAQFTWAHKVMRRNGNDAAQMNFAISVTMNQTLNEVKEASVAIGGTTVQRIKLSIIPPSNRSSLSDFQDYLMTLVEMKTTSLQKAQSNYCQTLAKNLCVKFCNWLKNEIQFTPEQKSEWNFKSTQVFDKISVEQPKTDLVGKPVAHASAYKHATGEAKFLDDIPKHKNELALEFILSTRAHAFVKNIDLSKCLEVEGVIGYIGHEDISSPEKNCFGLVVRDEQIFASEKVNCVGQIIGGIVAKSRAIAKKAVEFVQVEYEDAEPCVITIDDAVQHNSYFPDFGMTLENGNCNQEFPGCSSLEGKFDVGSQAHFYMEPQCCLAVPNGEDGEMEVISSTQNPMDTHLQVANVLDVPANRVVVKVKRVGGGFGGKESRSLMVALPAALAARKFQAPVRCVLDRRTDMLISGNRNPFSVTFSVTFDDNGKIAALRLKMYCNAGHSLDVSNAAMERAIINVDNTYYIPNFKAEGFVCKTNTASNTVFRGTGAPQAVLIIEHILDLIATEIKKSPTAVRRLNLYNEGDLTPYGQPLTNSTIRCCWDECLRASNFTERYNQVEEFNKKNEWKKRGISLNPAQYGVAYTAVFLNQASALINVYRDGSVLLSHGGVEIGQGLHSKMIQVATRELGISSDKIRIIETSTDKVPNGTPTSASSSSDLNGMAVIDACQKLMNQLKPYESAGPWENKVTSAYMDRVSLSATGFYKTPGIGWNEKTKRGSPFNYYSTGVACSEVELDCLTGQFQILRTDIVMDVGHSLNPAIDLGQIEGAFMQGVGLYTMEDLKFGTDGAVETLGPNTYKIPTAGDIPLEFNVSFLSGSSNPKAVYSSKTVGEPPLLLAPSVFFAIKDAIRHKVPSVKFEFNSPATVEKILMALQTK